MNSSKQSDRKEGAANKEKGGRVQQMAIFHSLLMIHERFTLKSVLTKNCAHEKCKI